MNLQAEVAELRAAQGRVVLSQTQSNVAPTILNKGTINNNNHNTQNNIHIHVTPRDFARDENTSYLDPEFLLECLRDMDVVKVLEELHFNPEHPENHNVRVKNQKKNEMEYVDNGRWVIGKKDQVLGDMLMTGWRVLHTYTRSNGEIIDDELDEEEKHECMGWLRKLYDEDPKLTREVKGSMFYMVLNNKAVILQKE